MPFTVINSTDVESGKPVTAEVQGIIKENFDDHEDRIQTLEAGLGQTYPPLVFRVGGPYSGSGAQSGIIKTTSNFSFEIIGVRLLIDIAGSSGITEIDIKKNGVSIFTTKPSVAFGAGNDSISINAVLDLSQVDVAAGDLLKLDITSVQAYGRGFTVRVDYVGA